MLVVVSTREELAQAVERDKPWFIAMDLFNNDVMQMYSGHHVIVHLEGSSRRQARRMLELGCKLAYVPDKEKGARLWCAYMYERIPKLVL